MKINEKIKSFLAKKGLTHKEIADGYNTTQQNVSRFLADNGRVPLDFVVWLVNEYPEIDVDRLIRHPRSSNIVREPATSYHNRTDRKEEILQEIADILDKHM